MEERDVLGRKRVFVLDELDQGEQQHGGSRGRHLHTLRVHVIVEQKAQRGQARVLKQESERMQGTV